MNAKETAPTYGRDNGSTADDARMIGAARREIAAARLADVPSDQVTLESPASRATPFAGPPQDSFTGYRVLRELHRGGQGVVYQAIQESTNRKVAIKVLKEGPFASPGDRARFDREVQVLGQLSHPNIVTIHDTGVAAGCQYFVMDYISGQPLDVYMASGERSIEQTLRLFAKICDAVNAAHLRGVIHRDLKPGNIRIGPDGEPQVLDFGLAKVVATEGEAAAMTVTGQFIGSVPWASPEQAEGSPAKIDVRTDVYSLGVVLYQMLTGKFPYEVVGNMRDVLDRIITAEPVGPRAIRKRIDDEVETIVLKCLAKERERRYQTAGELARDVRRYLAGEPIEAKRDSAWYLLRKTLGRQRRSFAVVGLVLLVILAVIWGWEQRRAARATQRNAEREAWVATLRQVGALPLEFTDPTHSKLRSPAEQGLGDAFGRAVDGVWGLVAAGESTTGEREALASALVFFQLLERPLKTLDDLRRRGAYAMGREGACAFMVRWGLRHKPGDFGFVVALDVRLNDQQVQDSGREQPRFVRGGYFTGFWGVPQLAVGRHVLSGEAEVRFARPIPGGDGPQGDYELLDVPAVRLPVGPFEMTVVEEYPPDYPLMIVDEEYAQRFSREFEVLGASLKHGSGLGDSLVLEYSIPEPFLDIACQMRLNVPALDFERSFGFVVGPGRCEHVDVGLPRVVRGADRWVVTVEIPLAWVFPERSPQTLVGSEILFEVTPSRAAALKTLGVEQFLSAQGSGRAVLADTRDETRRAAEALIYELFDELALWDEVRRTVEEDPEIPEAVRAAVREMLRVRYIPDSGPHLTKRGMAEYRLGRFKDALKTLQRADRTNSERFDGGTPTDVAYMAMTLHRLGRAEEARAALARLRAIVNDDARANDENARGLLREVEALLSTPSGD